MENKCGECIKPMASEGVYCHGCDKDYHFTCCGVREATYKTKTEEMKLKFKCRVCKEATIGSNMKTEIEELKNALQFHSDTYENMKTEIAELKKENSANKKEIMKMKTENDYLYRELSKLQERVNVMEQKDNLNCVEIHNLPAQPNEDLQEIVETIGSQLQIPAEKNLIKEVYRVQKGKGDYATKTKTKPTTNKKPPVIVVRFADKTLANQWIDKKKTGLSSVNIIGGVQNNDLYINEHLTQHYRDLYWQARITSKKLNYQFVWIKHGYICRERSKLQQTCLSRHLEIKIEVG